MEDKLKETEIGTKLKSGISRTTHTVFLEKKILYCTVYRLISQENLPSFGLLYYRIIEIWHGALKIAMRYGDSFGSIHPPRYLSHQDSGSNSKAKANLIK